MRSTQPEQIDLPFRHVDVFVKFWLFGLAPRQFPDKQGKNRE